MGNQKIIVSSIGSRQPRPTDMFPNGRKIFVDIECQSNDDAFSLMEILRGDTIYVVNERPLELP